MSDPAFTEEFDQTQARAAVPPAHASLDEINSLSNVRPVPRITVQAFCETQGVAKPIERLSEDRRMANAQTRVYMGGITAAIEFYQTAPTPNLIVIESTLTGDALMTALGHLSEVCDPTSKVVIIGHQNDVHLYRDLVKSGISEYLVAPVSIADLMSVISSLYIDPDAEPLGKSIAFVGAKGGVGSSTIAHNVAWAISTIFQNEVLVADMDLAFGTANINFDQDPPQSIAEAVFAPDRVDEAFLDRLLSKCAERLSLLASPSMLNRVYDFDEGAFQSIIAAAQRTAPTVVLDVPHSWNGWTRKTLASADEVVIVATPDLASLRNTKNLIDTIEGLRPNDFKPKLVLNTVGVPKRPEISVRDFTSPLNLMASAVIQFDPHLFGMASNNGRMLAESDPSNPTVAIISELAHIVTGRGVVIEKPKTGLQSMLERLKKK